MKEKRIIVVCGGYSSEREISLQSGKSVFAALKKIGYLRTTLFDLKRDNAIELIKEKPDIVFNALHGMGGEDGAIQGMLELAGIPYTGPGICCSAVCMDKIMTKRLVTNASLPTPRFEVYTRAQIVNYNTFINHIISEFGFPVVFKSPRQGSSIGIVIVRKQEEISHAVEEVFKYGNQLLVEQYIEGTEITLPIMGNEVLTMLPIIEITSEREFYDYTAKYTAGLCHHIIPACIDSETEKQVMEIGSKAYRILNCSGLSRIDFIVDRVKGPMIIEVNTSPGMTDMSLFPDAARYTGLSYEELVERILQYGFEKYQQS